MTSYQFTVNTTKHKLVRQGRIRRYVTENVTLQVDIRIEGKVCYLGYGYKEWTTKHNEGRYSATPYQGYVLHHAITPKEGDVWSYRGRTFVLGKQEGFLNYELPLLENGKQVATVKYEAYYKD